jgi:polyisoprenoid-binding protein YceI
MSRSHGRCVGAFGRLLISVLASLLSSSVAVAQRVPIDQAHSTVAIKVYKSGLFSAMAHDHTIQAPVSGNIDTEAKSVELSFNASEMKVLDPGTSDSERQQIDATMKGPKVLDVAQFPAIAFSSSAVTTSADHIQVTGTLKLHGVSRLLTVPVAWREGKYTSTVTLKQTDFGITPVKIAGGTVRVKDEIVIEFILMPESPTTAPVH